MPKTELRNGVKKEGKGHETEQMLSNGKAPMESRESENEAVGNNRGLPIDRGWAWVVLGGTLQ